MQFPPSFPAKAEALTNTTPHRLFVTPYITILSFNQSIHSPFRKRLKLSIRTFALAQTSQQQQQQRTRRQSRTSVHLRDLKPPAAGACSLGFQFTWTWGINRPRPYGAHERFFGLLKRSHRVHPNTGLHRDPRPAIDHALPCFDGSLAWSCLDCGLLLGINIGSLSGPLCSRVHERTLDCRTRMCSGKRACDHRAWLSLLWIRG